MYAWLWRHLPGNLAVRLTSALLLLLGVLALLFFVVFPYVEPRLPFQDVTVGDEATQDGAPGANGETD
jgi:hypothetical protein